MKLLLCSLLVLLFCATTSVAQKISELAPGVVRERVLERAQELRMKYSGSSEAELEVMAFEFLKREFPPEKDPDSVPDNFLTAFSIDSAAYAILKELGLRTQMEVLIKEKQGGLTDRESYRTAVNLAKQDIDAKALPKTVREEYSATIDNLAIERFGKRSPKWLVGRSADISGLKKSALLQYQTKNGQEGYALEGGVSYSPNAYSFGRFTAEPSAGLTVDISDDSDLSKDDKIEASLGTLLYWSEHPNIYDLSVSFTTDRRFGSRTLEFAPIAWLDLASMFTRKTVNVADSELSHFGTPLFEPRGFLSVVSSNAPYFNFGLGAELGEYISKTPASAIEDDSIARGLIKVEVFWHPAFLGDEWSKRVTLSVTNELRFVSDDDYDAYNLLEATIGYKTSKDGNTSFELSYERGYDAPKFVKSDLVKFGVGYQIK